MRKHSKNNNYGVLIELRSTVSGNKEYPNLPKKQNVLVALLFRLMSELYRVATNPRLTVFRISQLLVDLETRLVEICFHERMTLSVYRALLTHRGICMQSLSSTHSSL